MAARRVTWLGLGLIGLPMAARLAAQGWEVTGFDIDAKRRALARERGISPASSLTEALEGAGLVFTSLPTETVLVDLAPVLRGEIVVETSTVGPAASAQVGAVLAARGIDYLRAPISGSTSLAESGALTTFVSGPKRAFETAREAQKAYSRAQIWLGEKEEARYAKLAVNLMVAVTAGMMRESVALAQKGGIGWEAVLELLGESVVASPLVKYKLEPLRRRDYTPAATGALMLKDLELIVEAARQAGVEVPLAREVQAAYRAMAGNQLAGEDFFSLVKPS